ncbi:MAG: hypothetical protein ABH956_01110 [Candidatus Nealsonbacteria bacterium]
MNLNKGISAPVALTVIIVLAVLIGVGILLFNNSLEKEKAVLPVLPLSENETVNSQTFSTKEECEEKMDCECSFFMCDYVPEGKTFEEVCGEVGKGWRCVSN